jgi:glycerol kinase
MFMNIETLEWDQELLDYFEVDKSCLAEIVSNSQHYGDLKCGTALDGVPIAGMIGDQQAALVGNKCLTAGEGKNTYGTGCFMLLHTGEKPVVSNHGLLTTPAYKPGKDAKAQYALEGSIAVGGSSVKWLRDSMGLIKDASDIGKYASEVKDTGGVYFVTVSFYISSERALVADLRVFKAFSGLFAPYWDDSASGTIIGLTGYTTRCVAGPVRIAGNLAS